jgi:hypothetical protein
MKEVLHIHDSHGHIRSCSGYHDLSYFVLKVGSWSFGNSFHDKRWSLKTRNYQFGYCRMYLREEGEEELLNVKYVVYDEDYNIVPCKVMDKLYRESARLSNIYIVERYNTRWRWRIHGNYPGFRNGPVPGTGRGGKYNYLRTPRTTQERRMAIAHKEFTRGRRRFRTLPCAWDDLPRADRQDKHSWKKQKKRKQWM